MIIKNQKLQYKPGVEKDSTETLLTSEVSSWIREMTKICNIIFNPLSASSDERIRNSTKSSFSVTIV